MCNFKLTKICTRQRLLRLIAREGLEKGVLDKCIDEGDGIVHRHLLKHKELPPSFVEFLIERGANKAVRNMAKQRFNRNTLC